MPVFLRWGGRRVTSSSPNWMRPSSGITNPAMLRSSVVFPQPLGPSRKKDLAGLDAEVHPMESGGLPKRFVRSSIVSEIMRWNLARVGRGLRDLSNRKETDLRSGGGNCCMCCRPSIVNTSRDEEAPGHRSPNDFNPLPGREFRRCSRIVAQGGLGRGRSTPDQCCPRNHAPRAHETIPSHPRPSHQKPILKPRPTRRISDERQWLPIGRHRGCRALRIRIFARIHGVADHRYAAGFPRTRRDSAKCWATTSRNSAGRSSPIKCCSPHGAPPVCRYSIRREGHRTDLACLPPAKKIRGRSKTTIGDPGPMGRILVRGEAGHDIIAELYPLPNESVIDKPGKGAFFATDLHAILQNRGIKNLIVTGRDDRGLREYDGARSQRPGLRLPRPLGLRGILLPGLP